MLTFSDIFSKVFFVCLDKENLNLIAFISLHLGGQTFSQFHADSHAQKLLLPSCLLALITVCIHILKSNMADNKLYCMYFPATAARFVQKDFLQHIVSKLSSYKKSFVCFQKKWALQIYIFIEPKFRPPHHILTLEVAGETLQRSWETSLAAGSYIQPCLYGNLILAEI